MTLIFFVQLLFNNQGIIRKSSRICSPRKCKLQSISSILDKVHIEQQWLCQFGNVFLIFFFRARTTATCQTEIMGWRPNIERRGWNFEGGGWGNLSNFIFKIIFHFSKKRFIFQNSRLKLMMVFTMSLWKIMILQMKGKSWVYQLILRVRICTVHCGLSMRSQSMYTPLLFF